MHVVVACRRRQRRQRQQPCGWRPPDVSRRLPHSPRWGCKSCDLAQHVCASSARREHRRRAPPLPTWPIRLLVCSGAGQLQVCINGCRGRNGPGPCHHGAHQPTGPHSARAAPQAPRRPTRCVRTTTAPCVAGPSRPMMGGFSTDPVSTRSLSRCTVWNGCGTRTTVCAYDVLADWRHALFKGAGGAKSGEPCLWILQFINLNEDAAHTINEWIIGQDWHAGRTNNGTTTKIVCSLSLGRLPFKACTMVLPG